MKSFTFMRNPLEWLDSIIKINESNKELSTLLNFIYKINQMTDLNKESIKLLDALIKINEFNTEFSELLGFLIEIHEIIDSYRKSITLFVQNQQKK